MPIAKRAVATAELLLLFPSSLFMTALVVRTLQPAQYEPAHTAQRIVSWYAERPHVGLWLLLIALPLAALATGAATLLRSWVGEPNLRLASRETFATIRNHLATLFIAAATLIAGCILEIVALHVLAN